MDPFNSPERRKSLTPDPSPKGEGSRIKDLKDLKGFGALRLKLYLELSFKILKIILRINFKLHFEPRATPYKSEK